MTPFVLGMIAVLLAGPVPALLARAPRLHHTPFATMVLWQAVALAAVLSALGAGLSLITHSAWDRPFGLIGTALAVLSAGVTVTVLWRLVSSAHRVGTSLREIRRAHLEQLDLLADHRGGVRVVQHDVPLAYCVPRLASSRVVVSEAALERLEAAQLNAVFAHERAHLSARHDLVLEAFTVLHRAFPTRVSSSAALREVRLLVEILADRAALKVSSARDLGTALLVMVGGRTPEGAMGASAVDLVVRVAVLGQVRRRPIQTTVLLVSAWAVLVLPTALVVAPWLNEL